MSETAKTTHTPGPWAEEHDPAGYPGQRRIWSADGRIVATIHPIASPGETLTNARLIAAAPELLEALELALPYAKRAVQMAIRDLTRSEDADGHADGLVSIIDAAEAAIAEARGVR